MKITFRLIISFLLVALTASGVACDNEVVTDVGGNPVKLNTPYQLFRMFRASFFWISPYGGCPQGVQYSLQPNPNVHVVFESSSDDVRVSTKLNIKFTNYRPCSKSAFWRVSNSSNEDLIVLGGSKSSNDSMFTIERSDGNLYKFAFDSFDIGFVDISRLGVVRKSGTVNFFFNPVRV